MAGNIGYMPFPKFFRLGYKYKYCSISGVFSVLGVPIKVIDTVLESSTHMGPIIGYAISRIFQRGVGVIIPKISSSNSISGVLSALGALKKVVDTIFESS